MPSKLKGVILSIEDTIVPNGKETDKAVLAEVSKLIKFLQQREIGIVVFTNRNWTVGGKRALKDVMQEKWPGIQYISRYDDNTIPPKPQSGATKYVLDKMGWDATETVYIGSSENDMRTAVNGGLLFLRATWYANKTDYGFEFSTPKDIARFIDTFCLRDHLWCFEANEGNFSYFALAPFSTMKAEYTLYSEDARAAAKHGRGHPDFWIGALITSLYFSGVYQKIDYITVYPGHKEGAGNNIMNEAMSIFGKCFRKAFLSDLIIRHTTAQKSQTARNTGIAIDHLNQLNTIRLNKNPLRSNGQPYKTSPIGTGKTVLLIDDICTRGYSLEAARVYIEKAGAKAVMVSWLKTINTDIHLLPTMPKFNPYVANKFAPLRLEKNLSYRDNIVDHLAPGELTEVFAGYENWEWPE